MTDHPFTQMSESPLSTPSPDSISALFLADPLTLTDDALMALVIELRRRRNEFTAAEAAKALKPKAVRTKAIPQSPSAAAALDKPPSEISLEDLDD